MTSGEYEQKAAECKATSFDKFIRRTPALSLRPFQKASSRLTLVRWPSMKMECLTIVDLARRRFRRLIDPTPFAPIALRVLTRPPTEAA